MDQAPHHPALGCAAAFLLAVVGCGGEGKVEEATVLSSEPRATTTAPVAAAAGGGAAEPATSTPATATSTAATPAGGAAEGWGTIKGRVVFAGTPPAPKVLTTDKNPEVCATTPHLSERLVVDPDTKGVQYALVYVLRPTRVNPEAQKKAEDTVVEFDQKSCIFAPHVIALSKDSKVTLKSSDPVQHNINAKLRANSTYNNILAPSQSTVYDPIAAERGPIKVTCDIHNWMKAYWLIHDNPYFAVPTLRATSRSKTCRPGLRN